MLVLRGSNISVESWKFHRFWEKRGVRGGGSNPGGLVEVDEGKNVDRKEGLQMAPDPTYVKLRNEGDGFDRLEGVPDLEVSCLSNVWILALHP